MKKIPTFLITDLYVKLTGAARNGVCISRLEQPTGGT